MSKQYIVEFIGTFFLTLTVAFGNPVAVGAVLTALVYMGGYISGAQYNPAVTLALLLNEKISTAAAFGFMVVQLFAAVLAAGVYFFVEQATFFPQLGPAVSAQAGVLVEILCTFLLVSVILHVAVSDKTKGNQYYGIAIGSALLAIAFIGGPISGGAFNPAVGIGPLLFDFPELGKHTDLLLIYLLGPFIGGALAGIIYKILK